MSRFNAILDQLNAEREDAKRLLARIDGAIASLTNAEAEATPAPAPKAEPKRRGTPQGNRNGRPARYDTEEVVDVMLDARETGEPLVAALSEHFGISRTAANSLAGRARNHPRYAAAGPAPKGPRPQVDPDAAGRAWTPDDARALLDAS